MQGQAEGKRRGAIEGALADGGAARKRRTYLAMDTRPKRRLCCAVHALQ
jgi:hypothetical protein